ncbi:5-demethoxyubiquinol-8 5-hydroxylase UbiM [Pseudomonas sp. R2.Fl]|nr:5-demethoxyubiquinol-8 5-hydroxylase UbiM [Pseudomonas sp. R2.Fl]
MRHDVIIIGAGPAGLCLARALAGQSLRVALVERQPEAAIAEPAFDGREIALTQASIRLLRELGVWEHIPQDDVAPLRAARVMEGESPHWMTVEGTLVGRSQLGSLVPNHRIRAAAWRAIQDLPTLDWYPDARIESVRTTPEQAEVHLQDGTRLHASLLIAADSRFSETRRALGIGARQNDFGKSMLVCRMQHELPHHGVAWEWFGQGQTLAMLPLREHLSSAVLTVPHAEARRLQDLPAEAFAASMRERYGNRLGAMQLESSRHVYPLVGVYAHRFVGQRFAVAGDTAVGMHPVTAHGFNLGLASVERLADIARIARAQGRDLGSEALLSRYQRRHRAGSLPLYLATATVVRVFTDDRPPVRKLRETILHAGQQMVPFRRLLAAQLVDDAPLDAPLPARVRRGLAQLLPRRA